MVCSDWLVAEYAQCSEIWPAMIFTNGLSLLMASDIALWRRAESDYVGAFARCRGCVILEMDRDAGRSEHTGQWNA